MSLACEVCYEFYSSQMPARVVVECGHDFCGPCLQALILQQYSKAQCPKCRTYLLPQDQSSDTARLLVRSFSRSGDQSLFNSFFPSSRTLTDLSSRIDFSQALSQDLLRRLLQQVETAHLIKELNMRQSVSPKLRSKASGRSSLLSQVINPLVSRKGVPCSGVGVPPRSVRRRTITPGFDGGCEPGVGSVMWWIVIYSLRFLETLFLKYPVKLMQRFPRENRTQFFAVLQGVPLLCVAAGFLYRMINS
eukprot:Gregarina_sp_Poly_1__5026@NODE_2664_length_1854_cov_208_709010_g1690_i0_p1_GENE_NODE_2664_length_1854_cov_208_709010_g1690_i0NODE_2664_length_1854_cov_208_709010_g1690_i0_p1_ORF_typecomplete_len248_score15_02zfRING_5/PF14634_6/3_3e08zfC3HC4_2/PF13923_6/1_4e07zfC3HC4_3/PF13920_6/1_1e06zfC3HC4/PF00097_25/1_6e06ProkRING_4/PF14447_6/4_7e06zfRING_2/PF13639_6/5_5e06zfRING_UBOX/PF13445_6/1_3e05zfANAPC11/PF12861_7/2_5e05zfC3HC4_4/PF15227_6/0_00078zfRING_6/PF14835_6/0_0082zfrbx1/PF12678_7/0_052zfC3HC4_5/